MKNLCAALLLFLATSSGSGFSQVIALVDAPEPLPTSTPGSALSSSTSSASSSSFSSSPSLGNGAASAILPVRRSVPDRKPSLGFTDWTLLGAGAALRFLDYKSTVKCMSDPANFREVELPSALVHNRPAFGAFEASTVVANYYVYRLFAEHHHRGLARFGQIINLGAMAWTVGRNYYELNEFWPRESNLLRQQTAANPLSGR